MNFTGDGGDNIQTGTGGEDSFDYSQGGHDTLSGGDDDDTFLMGASLDPLDVIDGGDQINLDGVIIGGDYSAGLTLSNSMLKGIEALGLDAGDYQLKLADGVAGSYFQVTMQSGATGVFDASAVTSANLGFAMNVGVRMVIIGGGGDDRFEQYSPDRGNVLVGGAGNDQLDLQMPGDFKAANHSFSGFETLRVISNYKVVLADGNVAAGEVLAVNSFSGQHMDVDGHKETDGRYDMTGDMLGDRMVAGHGDDSLAGSGGDDTLTGGHGADALTGGAGADVFVFVTARDSWKGAVDHITDLEAGDSIDLTRMDADRAEAGHQAFTLVQAFSGHAGELVLRFDAAADTTWLEGDVNGNGKADFAVAIAGDHHDFTGLVI